MELLEKYEKMESEQKDLKMKLNDLEKNQKALMEMTYPKTMKPRTIVKARKSVTFKGRVHMNHIL